MQEHVITWLAALPVVLAAFRAITLGERFSTTAVTGRRGDEGAAQSGAILAGLAFLGLLFLSPGADADVSSIAVALVTLAFGAFVLSFYLVSGFRERLWQRFLASALLEAGLYWLLLGVARFLVDRGLSTSGTESQAAIWVIVVVASVGLILGTFGRMARDLR